MAGGVKKPVNIFRLKDLGEPKGVFNWRLWFAVVSFGLLGAARGIDEGLISGAFNSPDFKKTIRYGEYSSVEQANIKANVSAMVQIGSVAGALIAFLVCDRIGRIMATRFLCVLWVTGIIIFMAGGVNGSLGAIYAGRFIAGLGVGQTPVVGPVYISEIAPSAIRGLCTAIFTGFVYLGIVLAYFTNYGCAVNLDPNSHNRWLVPTSLHITMAGIIFILTFLQYESPRFLVKQGQPDKAAEVMAHLRRLPADGEYVTREVSAIQAALDHELEATRGVGLLGKLREMFLDRSNLYRVYLATMVQLLSQWSGAGSITLYAPDLFRILGITGSEEGLLVTAVFGIVKLVSALVCALFLVDVIGRKRSLLTGIVLQAVAMIYVASFLTAVPQLGVEEDFVLPESNRAASRGAIAMIYLSGCGWALGWNSMQYILTAELFPLRIRALATSWAMTLHFANQYGNSRAVPNMLLPVPQGGISPKGTFWCFAAVTLLGGIWVWFSVPETSGRSLESMDRLFDLPWYKVGLYGNRHAEEQDRAHDEKQRAAEGEHVTQQHVEKKASIEA
ncbi:major facilitator superfamily protein [Hirsutella rhossiliensis]|uniref:Sugar transporter domain-containing protein n=1 Tax=Hirsutella rhossiliensis TaxID=111463 RepID=A0A9P8MMY1_9HYPO|nr:sugar transporter domain-containing protein [Hirsutella rhossiliensis]KAH0958247.1 sugar transporter domain-containing protein [Hirsutella rhossiliensis]